MPKVKNLSQSVQAFFGIPIFQPDEIREVDSETAALLANSPHMEILKDSNATPAPRVETEEIKTVEKKDSKK